MIVSARAKLLNLVPLCDQLKLERSLPNTMSEQRKSSSTLHVTVRLRTQDEGTLVLALGRAKQRRHT